MNRFNFKIKRVKLAFALLVVSALVILILYNFLIFKDLNIKNGFINQVLKVSNENEHPVFGIQKVTVYSNADAFNEKDNHSLQNMSITQYSDIAIYIDNSLSSSDMTAENTISKLYIDNIRIENNSLPGEKVLNYKNPLSISKYLDLAPTNKIDFKVIKTNDDNENTNYDEPTFYTDCSNPISLGFLNKNIVTDYSISSESKSVSFNGKVLKEANIPIEALNYSLVFTIHIINNANEKFSYDMRLNVDFNEDDGNIYNGYSNITNTTTGNEYHFFKEI